MRPFSNLFSALTSLALLWLVLQKHPSHWPLIFAVLAGIAVVFHLVLEGAHWQMYPAYGAAVLLLAALFAHGWITLSCGLAGLFCLLISDTLVRFLPMFRFAPTTGPHLVGTSIHHMIDVTREDASPSGKRELMIQLWYPAEASRNARAPYRRPQETTRVSSYQGVLRTSSRLDAPLASGAHRFAVLLFHPAWNGRRTQNTFLTEELASHGFVVAAIDHTGNSEPIAFPDGRVVRAQHIRAMEDVSTSTADEVQRIGNAEVDRQTLDGRFVLDQLEEWNLQQGSRWHQRLDTSHAGAFGHSLGGAVSIECWATDPRIRAAMNMDGWTFGTQASTGRRRSFPETAQNAQQTEAPLLFFYEERYNALAGIAAAPATGESSVKQVEPVEQQVDAWDAAHVRQLIDTHNGYIYKLHGANHLNFTDRTLTSPFRRLAGGSSIDPRRAHSILRAYAVSFFLQTLRGVSSPFLSAHGGSAPNRYTEVTRLAIPAPAKSE